MPIYYEVRQHVKTVRKQYYVSIFKTYNEKSARELFSSFKRDNPDQQFECVEVNIAERILLSTEHSV